MILNPDDKMLIVHRRLFPQDHSRFFVGTVKAYQDGIVCITGYSFARDSTDGNYRRKDECHTKLLSISSGTLFVYLLPPEVAIDQLKMIAATSGLCLTDGKSFTMNMAEWIHHE